MEKYFKKAQVSLAVICLLSASHPSFAEKDFTGYQSTLTPKTGVMKSDPNANPTQGNDNTTAQNVSEQPLTEEQKRKIAANKEALVRQYSTIQKESKLANLEVENGVLQIVYIARNHLNRIETPFAEPLIVSAESKQNLTIKKKGNVIYLGTNTYKTPMTIYVSPKDDSSISIPIVLISLDIPPKNIVLNIKGYSPKPISSPEAEKERQEQEIKRINTLIQFEKKGGDDYEGMLDELNITLAKGEIPQGYELTPPLAGDSFCAQKGIKFTPFQRLTGVSQDVIILKATNFSSQPLEFKEKNCYIEGVRSVSSYPHTSIYPGKSSEIYIAVGRDIKQKPHARKRAY